MMSQKESNFTTDALSKQEKKLFDRQLRLPGWNQKILKDSTVLIVGVGGLGVEIAKNLAMVGVGHLILVDMDTIEYSNLNRQILFIGAPEGSYKAEMAARKLKEINPFIKVTFFNKYVQDIDPEIFQQSDLYIAGLDNVKARLEMNRRAIHNNRPLIDAGTAAFNGHVYTVFPGDNACLDCDPMREREEDVLGACTLVGRPRKPIHCVLQAEQKFEEEHGRKPDPESDREMQWTLNTSNEILIEHFPDEPKFSLDGIIKLVDAHEPTVITINAVMASIQSQEAIKILHHLKSAEHQKLGTLQKSYMIYNGLTGNWFKIEKPKNPKCEMCGNNAIPLFKIKVKSTVSLMKVIEKIIEKKSLAIDPDFPPDAFRIDNSEGMVSVDIDEPIVDTGIKNFETLFISGFEDEKSIYLQLKLEV